MNFETISKIIGGLRKTGIAFLFSLAIQPRVFFNYCFLFLSKPKKDFTVRWHPVGAMFFVNDACNMKCVFCGRMNGIFKKMSPAAIKDMTFLQFKKIFGRLKEAMHIVFCGFGEPLLNKDIFEMIAYSKRKGKITTLTTNGILLDDRAIDNILGSKLDVLSISIKTSKKDFFCQTTGLEEKYFDLIIGNVMDLVKKRNGIKSKTEIMLSFVCSRDNIKAMEDMVELANHLKVDGLRFLGLAMPNIPASKNRDKLFFQDDAKLAKEFAKLKNKAKIEVILPRIIKNNRGGGCSFADNFIGVDASGDVSPCCGIPPQKRYGNVFSGKNVLNEKLFVFLRKTLSSRLTYSCLMCRNSYCKKN